MIWFLLLLLLHLLVCAILFLLIYMRRLHISYALLPMVLLVPPVGFLLALFVHFHEGREANQISETEIEKLTVDNELYKSIDYQKTGHENSIVPIQEALLIDDEEVKRTLMLDVLNQDTSQYVPLLQKAREDSDTEVSHYAITAMVELQKEYDVELQKVSGQYYADRQNEKALNQYIVSLHNYLEIGLLEGSMLTMYRNTYLQLLEAHEKLCGAQLETAKARFDTEIALENYSAAALDADEMCKRWPLESTGYLARLQICAAISDSAGVRAVLAEIKQKHIYVNTAGREIMEFWNHETKI
ncbi:MAG: hypothetical protein RSC58_01990 [Ruthenibacterium sp.]